MKTPSSSNDSDSADSSGLRLGIRALLTESTPEQQHQSQVPEPDVALSSRRRQKKNDGGPVAPPRHTRRRKRVRVATTDAECETEESVALAVADRNNSDGGGETADGLDDIFAWASAKNVPSSPPTKAAIVRSLRAEELKLEARHKALVKKWRTEIADPALLVVACEAAKQRWITSKYEDEQRRLRDQLLLQQLYLASMQVALTESPLMKPHNSISIFQTIHDEIHLRANESATERAEKLMLRSDLGLKLAPSFIDKFVNPLVGRATPLLPFTTSTMSADLECTYLATVSVSKIENATVTRVFGAVMQYFNSLDTELSQHYNASHEIKPIQSFGPMRNYSQLRYSTDSPFRSVSNTVFAATLSEDQGLVVIDFVDSDEMFAEVRRDGRNDDGGRTSRQKRDITVLLSITSTVDPQTQRECVLVRHLRVHRFNLLPSSPILLNEMKITQAYSNGDLFVAVVCRHLKETITGTAAMTSY